MTLWQTSLTYQIWVWLCDVYEDSTLHRFLAAAGRWCSGQVEESRILRPLCREGIAARSWRDSFLCRVLSALVNLPGTLLHAWYKAWNLTFEDSFFARLAFDMGDSASIAQFWCIAALWCIPYERWNNAYSFMTGVLLLLLFYAGAMRTGRRLDVARIGFYPALMLAAVTLAVIFSYAPGLSARFLIYHVSAALLVVITVSAVRNGEDLKRLCAGAAVCVGATGAYGIVQRIQGVKVNPSYVDLKVNAGMPGRVFSIFDNPNTFAQVLLLLLPLVLALFLTAKHWQWKAICAGIFCVGGMAMAMTYSRASWVGLAVAMAVFVFLWKPKLIPAFILLCVLAVPFLPTTVLNRILTITNTADSSTSSRVSLYKAAIEVIRRSPLTGAGLGTAATQTYLRCVCHVRRDGLRSGGFLVELSPRAGHFLVHLRHGHRRRQGLHGRSKVNDKNIRRMDLHTANVFIGCFPESDCLSEMPDEWRSVPAFYLRSTGEPAGPASRRPR